MLGGISIAVTFVPLVSQWAEMHNIALGVGILCAIFGNPLTNSLSSIAFIGLPCPKNNTGIFSVSGKFSLALPRAVSVPTVPNNRNTLILFEKVFLSIASADGFS